MLNKKIVLSSVLVGSLFSFPNFAVAETAGLMCTDGAQIGLSAAGEAYTLSDAQSACEIGFSVEGGYWAIASSEDGLMQGAAGGYRGQDGANHAAIAACEAEGADSCAVISYGFDDGTGPAVEVAAEVSEEAEMAEAEEAAVEETPEEPKLVATVKAVVVLVELSEAE